MEQATFPLVAAFPAATFPMAVVWEEKFKRTLQYLDSRHGKLKQIYNFSCLESNNWGVSKIWGHLVFG